MDIGWEGNGRLSVVNCEGPVYFMDLREAVFCAPRGDCYTDVCCLCAVADLAGPSA